jgi:GT2 family glycosyltransferase
MSSDMLYSVVVPTCGRVHLLTETLQSLAEQGHPAFELIVADDSPREDDQRAIRRACDEFQVRTGRPTKYVFSRPRLYQAANTNQGLHAARGALVRILHSDDLLRADALQREAQLFEQHPTVEVVFQDCLPFTEKVAWGPEPRATLVQPAHHLRVELSHATALPSGLVFRRSIFERTGGMDERLRFLCDWEFFCRLLLDQARHDKLVCRLSPGLFGWRTHADSVTGSLWKTHFEEHELFIREFLARPELEALGVFAGRER